MQYKKYEAHQRNRVCIGNQQQDTAACNWFFSLMHRTAPSSCMHLWTVLKLDRQTATRERRNGLLRLLKHCWCKVLAISQPPPKHTDTAAAKRQAQEKLCVASSVLFWWSRRADAESFRNKSLSLTRRVRPVGSCSV